MKQTVLTTLVLCLLVCLCACGKDTATPTTLPAKPTTEPTTELTTVATTEPTTVATTEPTTVPTTELTTNPPTVPSTLAPTIPTTIPTTAPTTEPTTVPTTEPATEPTTMATTDPTTVATTEPTTVATTEPTTVATTEPTTVATTEPTTVATTEPTTAPTTAATTVPTTKPAVEIDPAILGRYKLYKMKDNYGTYGLETIIPSGRGGDYIQLNADGTADVSKSGETLFGLEWDVQNMIIRDGKNYTIWPQIEGDILTVTNGYTTLSYMRDDSADWENVATGFDALRTYINRHGSMVNWERVFSYEYSGHTVKMTNKDSGAIIWNYTGGGITLKMDLKEHSSLQTITFTYGDVTGTATVELATYDKTWALESVQVDEGDVTPAIEKAVNDGITTMVQLALQKLKPAGIYLDYLCY